MKKLLIIVMFLLPSLSYAQFMSTTRCNRLGDTTYCDTDNVPQPKQNIIVNVHPQKPERNPYAWMEENNRENQRHMDSMYNKVVQTRSNILSHIEPHKRAAFHNYALMEAGEQKRYSLMLGQMYGFRQGIDDRCGTKTAVTFKNHSKVPPVRGDHMPEVNEVSRKSRTHTHKEIDKATAEHGKKNTCQRAIAIASKI